MVFALLGPVGFFAPVFLWIIPLVEIAMRWRSIVDEAKEERLALLWKYGFLFIVPLYGLLTVVWSINPQDAVATAFKVFTFITLGAILIGAVKRDYTEAMRDRAFTWAAYGLIAAELVILADLALGGVVYKSLGHDRFTDIVYSRGSAIVALTLLPIAVALARRAKWAVFTVFVVLGVVTVFLLSSESAMLALALSGIVYAIVWWDRRLFWAVLAPPIIFILVAAPAFSLIEFDNRDLCAIKAMKPTAAHRIIIWQFATEMTLRKPIAGWGMDSARAIPGGSDVVSIAKCFDPSRNKIDNYVGERLPLHPHNSAFQLWLELGAIGVLLAVLAIVHLLWRAGGAVERGGRALVAAVFSSSFIVYNVSFGIWQSWLIFACIILFILTSLSGGTRAANE